MNSPASQLDTSKNGNVYTISDQLKINKKELILYPLPMFVFIGLVLIVLFGADILTGILLSALLSLVFGLLYVIFRFSAWIFYREINIDLDNNTLIVKNKILNLHESTKISIGKFDRGNLILTEQNRGGHKKYILQYRNHKITDILIIGSEEAKKKIQSFLSID